MRLIGGGVTLLLRLADQYGRFGGDTEREKFEVLRWLFWDNHKLTGYMAMATYRLQRTFTRNPDPQVLAYFRKRLDDFLSILTYHCKTMLLQLVSVQLSRTSQ
jgi:glutathione S-transferase